MTSEHVTQRSHGRAGLQQRWRGVASAIVLGTVLSGCSGGGLLTQTCGADQACCASDADCADRDFCQLATRTCQPRPSLVGQEPPAEEPGGLPPDPDPDPEPEPAVLPNPQLSASAEFQLFSRTGALSSNRVSESETYTLRSAIETTVYFSDTSGWVK